MKPYLLLDAGGTLVFPDPRLFAQLVRAYAGYDVPERRFLRAASELTYQFDLALEQGVPLSEIDASRHYFEFLLERAGVGQAHATEIAKQIRERHRTQSVWRYTDPWLVPTLNRLASAGYRMAVISNSDGRVKQQFEELGLAGFFEQIFDSDLVGFAKPDRRLFDHALAELGLQAGDCLYVGDIFYIDVLGANTAGMPAVHLDPYGFYQRWPGIHLEIIQQLPDFLQAADFDLRSPNLMPFAR